MRSTPIFYRTGGGGEIIIGISTHYLAQPVRSDFIVYAGSAYIEDSAGDFIIDSKTLTSGGVITVSGTPVSYGTIKGEDGVFGFSTWLQHTIHWPN